MKSKKTKSLFDEEFRREKIAVKDPLTILSSKVNWEQFRPILEKTFAGVDYSQGGRPPYDRLMMFKILLLQEYYGISDDQMEFQLLDRLSFQSFIGQELKDQVPDAKTIWLFRETLSKAGTIDKLFELLKNQLERVGLIAHKGKIIDASFAEVPIQRNTPKENQKLKDGEVPNWKENKLRQKDTDADWTKKNNQSHFGYKKHVKADSKSKLITNFEVTPASVHDSQVLEELMESKDIGQPVYGDSAYYSKEIIDRLKESGFKPKILEKGYRNKPLTKKQIERNKKHSSTRCRVEHVFAWMRQHTGYITRGVGIVRITAKTTLQIIGYNLSRAVYLITHHRKRVSMI